MNERIKEIRKCLNLTQKFFGDSIGLSESSISKIEKGSTYVTDRVIYSICREFDVNEDWLRTGAGGPDNMFVKHDHDEEIKEYLKDVSEGKAPILESILRVYFSLPKEGQRAFNEFVINLSKDIARHPEIMEMMDAVPEEASPEDTLPLDMEDSMDDDIPFSESPELDEYLESLGRCLRAEKNIPDRSSASKDLSESAG